MRMKIILSVFFFVLVFGAASFWSIENFRSQTRHNQRVMQQLNQQSVTQQQEKTEIEGLKDGTFEVTE